MLFPLHQAVDPQNLKTCFDKLVFLSDFQMLISDKQILQERPFLGMAKLFQPIY